MEYYNSETYLMEELMLVKDMEYYANVEDLDYTLNNLDSCLPTNNNNIISSSNAHCSFQDYSDFPNVDIQTFNFPISYELQGDQFTQLQCWPNTNLHDFHFQQDYSSINDGDDSKSIVAPSKDEPVPEMPIFCLAENESRNKMKKVSGQPSKNLMAERRRRKRLNDRLSMLRSVVPKISKMDRTSILGDTIDYMKELLERINNLQEELMDDGGAKQMTILKDGKANEVVMEDGQTRIKISCAMKPGLLLSTMKTVEELGLEIQQCVISCCFSDFTMQASCSQDETRDAEDIKQALNINAPGILSLTSSTFNV